MLAAIVCGKSTAAVSNWRSYQIVVVLMFKQATPKTIAMKEKEKVLPMNGNLILAVDKGTDRKTNQPLKSNHPKPTLIDFQCYP